MKNLLYLGILLTLGSCGLLESDSGSSTTNVDKKNIESKAYLELENKSLRQELIIESLRDSLNTVQKLVLNLNDSITELKKSRTSKAEGKYSYILQYKKKYPHEVELYTKGALKTTLLSKLGPEKYQMFMDYMALQTPIEIINGETSFITGMKARSGGDFSACLEIDFLNNKMSAAIWNKGELIFVTDRSNQSPSKSSGRMFTWMYNKDSSFYKKK